MYWNTIAASSNSVGEGSSCCCVRVGEAGVLDVGAVLGDCGGSIDNEDAADTESFGCSIEKKCLVRMYIF